MIRRLDERVVEPEVMDQPDLDGVSHAQALATLGRLNAWSNSAGIAYGPIRDAARAAKRPLRVLDIACGGGDTAIAIARRAKRDRLAIEVEGCDISGRAVDFADEAARKAGTPLRFFRHDLLAQGVPQGYDIVHNALFLHHLAWDDAVRLLTAMREQCGTLAIAQDLLRNVGGYCLAQFARHVLSRSPVVYADSILSVRAAFTLDEAKRLAGEAGMGGAVLTRHWPCRYRILWRRADG